MATAARTDTDGFLLDALGQGQRLATEIEAEAASVGITAKQLRDARARLGVQISREGDRRSRWSLPTEAQQPSVPERARSWLEDHCELGELSTEQVEVGR